MRDLYRILFGLQRFRNPILHHAQGSRIGTSKLIFWLLSQANIGKNPRLESIEIQSRSSQDRGKFLTRYRSRRANFGVSYALKTLFAYSKDTLCVSKSLDTVSGTALLKSAEQQINRRCCLNPTALIMPQPRQTTAKSNVDSLPDSCPLSCS